MTLFVCWVVFPVVISVLAIGCGLLVEWMSGLRLPGALIPPLGLAAVIVAGSFTTYLGATARLTVPVVVALAVCGYGLGLPRTGTRVDAWAMAAAVTVFACYGAPIVLSGEATFAGYITLDDTSTWLALTDWVMEHGRTVSGLAPSTFELVLHDYLDGGVPLGSFMPLGIGGKLTGQDIAWLFQPTMALYGAMLALSIYASTSRLVRSPPLRALVAGIAAQPALLFAYAFWSGIKETAAAFVLALLAAAVTATFDRWPRLGATIPAAVAAAALLSVLSLAGGTWLIIPALAVTAALALRGHGALVRSVATVAALVAVLALPALVLARTFISGAASSELTQSGEVANLGHPLDLRQLLGIWPTPDFRGQPDRTAITNVLLIVLVLAVVGGVAVALRRRAWAPLLYLTIGAFGALLIAGLRHVGLSSPWINAKAMAMGSPALVAAGMVGAVVLVESGRRTEGLVVAAMIAGGVLWSNSLTYSGVWLAPRQQLTELERIGERFAGDGPTLSTASNSYGPRHFLRRMDAENPSGRRRRPVNLTNGGVLEKGAYADLDAFALDSLLVYRTLVVRRSPAATRPPSSYQLASQGDWWEVWQRNADAPQILAHVPAGSDVDPAATVPCADIERLAGEARSAGGRLAAVVRVQPPIALDLSQASHPATWAIAGSAVIPSDGGLVTTQVQLPASARYGMWLGGSLRRRVEVSFDGREVASATGLLSAEGYLPLGDVDLSAGAHRIELRYEGSILLPGRGRYPMLMGPLVFSRTTAASPVRYVDPSAARTLCGQRLDWVEAIGP